MSANRWGVLLLATVGVFACGQASEESNEARLFLDRYDGLDSPDLADRRRRIDALLATPLHSEDVTAVRDECVGMHDLALIAEERSAEALELTEAVEAGDRDALERGNAAIQASEVAATAAGEKQERCDRLLASLRTRHSPRR